MDEENHYKVTFNGGLVSGMDREQVKQNLAGLFKSSTSTIEKLFSGRLITIKKNLPEKTALTYQQAMLKAGAIAQVEAMDIVETIDLAPPPEPEVDDEDDLPPPPDLTTDAVVVKTEQSKPMELEPVGSRMSEPKESIVAAIPETEHLELAPAGSDVGQAKHKLAAVDPDISQYSLAEPGEKIEQLKHNKELLDPDISGLSLENP